MKNLDAHHDGLLAAHNKVYECSLPWEVDCADDGEGYVVIDDGGANDGNVYETKEEAQDVADTLNRQAMEFDSDYYID